ncbi:MAG: hypothetical protein ACRDDY_13835 [Clostridium sp.]|uniref:hypothetical protein n=1 Tax=Clostridium sp. TaxID=1506 RepID=UPI003EE7FEC6
MSALGLREVVRNFQANSGLQGKERIFLLNNIVSAAVAYSTICPIGKIEESGTYFDRVAREVSEQIVSDINEIQLCNTHYIMRTIRDIWLMRYNIVNTPMFIVDFAEHRKQMTVFEGKDLTDKYNAWIGPFSKTISGIIREQ